MDQQYFEQKQKGQDQYDKMKKLKNESKKKLIDYQLGRIQSHALYGVSNADEKEAKIEEYLDKEEKRGQLNTYKGQYKHSFHPSCRCNTCSVVENRNINKRQMQGELNHGSLQKPSKLERLNEKIQL